DGRGLLRMHDGKDGRIGNALGHRLGEVSSGGEQGLLRRCRLVTTTGGRGLSELTPPACLICPCRACAGRWGLRRSRCPVWRGGWGENRRPSLFGRCPP